MTATRLTPFASAPSVAVSSRAVLTAAILFVAVFSAAREAAGEVVQPGVQYTGETTLEFPEYGVSLLLPAGWIGGVPPEGEYLVMQNAQLGAHVFAGLEEMTVSQAADVMNQTIDVGNGIFLNPAGEVAVADSVLTADYTVSGVPNPLAGLVVTVVGADGWGISFVAAVTPENLDPLREAVGGMRRSLAAVAPSAPSASSPGGTGSWVAELNGYKLTRFFTRSGYTEESYIWLCPDFRFFFSFNAGGFGGGASGAFQSENAGRWSVAGDGTGGTLTLTYNDGSTTRYVVSLDGTKLFLDEKRWFREATSCD